MLGDLGEDDVTFKVNIGTLYAAGIKLFDGNTLVFENNKAYAADSISASHIINTTIHKNYINKKYDKNYDLDRKIVTKIRENKFIYFFLNSRKIYLPKLNITELSKIKPQGNYAKNKLITESYLKKKLGTRLVSLRISNVIGKRKIKSNRNNHKLFLDNFIKYKKQKKRLIVNNDFKDFITINHFCL